MAVNPTCGSKVDRITDNADIVQGEMKHYMPGIIKPLPHEYHAVL